ncbi:hypothetical protein JD844_028715 [Phrynosoma platyrhinos]|uniref:Cat eye syndrome critical region protein 5 n=1 Tax=Phrynosoma platyrhinos TaxID=52577 RepID=A0ABQ7SI86_PHRPL|nr:hypothetical protein JD844_028715 [Phrynosoma platyrhinos]
MALGCLVPASRAVLKQRWRLILPPAGVLGGRPFFCREESSPGRPLGRGCCGAPETTSPSFGFLFDIDGVLLRGRLVIPAAKKAFQKLTDAKGRFRVPVAFVTNAGNCSRDDKAEELSEALGFKVSPEWVILSHSPLHLFHQFHDKCMLVCGQGPVEENARKFGHGTFLVCLENIYKKMTGKDLKYEALIGKPSTVTYRYAEHVIKQQMESCGWTSPLRQLYAVGDNPMADIYGANLYNRYLQAQAEVNVTAMAAESEEHLEVQRNRSISVGSAESCLSILVCTGVYNPYGDMPGDRNENMLETAFHGHRDFHFDPSLVEASHVVNDVNDAVELVFQKENWKQE